MSDTIATTNVGDTEVETAEEFKLERTYFAPDALATASEYLTKVSNHYNPETISRNYDPEKEFPSDYGICVMPISKRTGSGNVVIGVAIAAIPDPSIVARHEKGSTFIQGAIIDNFMAKVANSVRPRADGSTSGTMPFSIEDFIERRGGGSNLKTYTEIAPAFVKGLRLKGLKFITSSILRQVLQSAAFAASQFDKIDQPVWERVLDTMTEYARKKGLDPAVLVNWRETRDQVEVPETDELDIEDLGDLVS